MDRLGRRHFGVSLKTTDIALRECAYALSYIVSQCGRATRHRPRDGQVKRAHEENSGGKALALVVLVA